MYIKYILLPEVRKSVFVFVFFGGKRGKVTEVQTIGRVRWQRGNSATAAECNTSDCRTSTGYLSDFLNSEVNFIL